MRVAQSAPSRLLASNPRYRADCAAKNPSNTPMKGPLPESLCFLECNEGQDHKAVGSGLATDVEREILPYLIPAGYERKSSQATTPWVQKPGKIMRITTTVSNFQLSIFGSAKPWLNVARMRKITRTLYLWLTIGFTNASPDTPDATSILFLKAYPKCHIDWSTWGISLILHLTLGWKL